MMDAGGRELSDVGEKRRQSMSGGSAVTPVRLVSLTAQTCLESRFIRKKYIKMNQNRSCLGFGNVVMSRCQVQGFNDSLINHRFK